MADQTQSLAPGAYRFFVVNEFDGVISDRWLECINDADAHAMATTLITEACGIEVWDAGHRVLKLARNLPAV